jgi:hypothetical protein
MLLTYWRNAEQSDAATRKFKRHHRVAAFPRLNNAFGL